MSSLPLIFGWTPPRGEEYVDIPPRPDPPRPTLEFFGSQASQSINIGMRPSSPVASSPASSNSSLSLEGGFQSEPYPEPVRRGNSAWVARPRNAFIIFRCEFSRQHTREGKRVRRRAGTAPTEKSLSKRAAEAWHQLSPEEKNPWKERAEREKETHARLHPDYRFQPKKRRKTGSMSRSESQPLTSPLAAEPAVLAPTPRYPLHAAAPQPQPPPLQLVDIAVIKTGRRRSASVPSFPIGQHTFMSGQWATEYPKLAMKRSRSVMANRPAPFPMTHPASPYEVQSFDPRLLESTPSGYYTPEESFGTVQSISPGEFAFLDHFSTPSTPAILSPLAQGSPSLSMWNGEVDVAEASAGWASPATNLDDHPHQSLSLSYPEYPTPADIRNYAANDTWTPAPPQYPVTTNAVNGLDNPGALFSPSIAYDTAYDTTADSLYALQLQDYGHLLQVHTLENSDDATISLDNDNYFECN